MDKNKIGLLVIGVNWPPETFLSRLFEGLAGKGVEISVAANLSGGALLKQRGRDNIKVIQLFSGKDPILRRVFMIVRLFLAKSVKNLKGVREFWTKTAYLKHPRKRLAFFLYKLLPLIGHSAGIIHFQWNSVAIEYLPYYELLNAAVLISCRGTHVNIAPHNPERPGMAAGLKETFEKADAVHCVSDNILREACKFGLSEAKAHVIRPAVDTAFFHPPVNSEIKRNGRVEIVTVGYLWWRKGYEYALLAMKKLIDKGFDAAFRIVSSRTPGKESMSRILFTIRDLGLEKNVSILGKMPPEDVRRILWESDIFLLSSLSEGISNAVLEAMACGLPVVTTDCGGMREVVKDGVDGLIVPVRDHEAMSRALGKLAGDRDLRGKIGAAASEKIKNGFALNDQIEQFSKLYRSLL